jgi:hypothetical protein
LYNGLDFEHVALTASTDPDDDRWWQGAVYTGIVIHNLFSKYVENVLGMVANSTLAGLFNGRPDAVDMTDSIEGLIYELKPLTYMNKPRRNAADMQLSNYLFEAWLNDKLNMRLGDSHSITQGKESMMIGHVVNYKMQKLAVTLWVDNKRDSGLVFYSTRVVSDRREAFKRGFTELSENLKDVLKYMPPVGPRMIPKRQ